MHGEKTDPGSDFTVALQHPSCSLPADRFRRVLTHVLSAEGITVRRLVLVVAGRKTVQNLHRRYRACDEPTDVLAFDYHPAKEEAKEQVVDGEIYIDFDTARERCREFGADEEEEAMRYAIHGLLHLIGYLDKTPVEKAKMHALEDRYLRATGY